MAPGCDSGAAAMKASYALRNKAKGWSAERDDDIVAAIAEGFTQAEIAEGLRISRPRVGKIVARLRLYRRLPPKPGADA